MIDFESHSARTLLALADGREGIDPARCALAFVHLGAAERLRCGLHRALAQHRLSELPFAVLVLLSAAGPEPIPMSVLASQAGVSRPAVTDAIDCLELSGLANRTRDSSDRRIIRARITAAGRTKLGQAIDEYLRTAMHAAAEVAGIGQGRALKNPATDYYTEGNEENEGDKDLE